MRKSNFALRLQSSLMEEARKLAMKEGVALNQLINVALAEKLGALRTQSYFAERAARADAPKALAILKRAGAGKAPRNKLLGSDTFCPKVAATHSASLDDHEQESLGRSRVHVVILVSGANILRD